MMGIGAFQRPKRARKRRRLPKVWPIHPLRQLETKDKILILETTVRAVLCVFQGLSKTSLKVNRSQGKCLRSRVQKRSGVCSRSQKYPRRPQMSQPRAMRSSPPLNLAKGERKERRATIHFIYRRTTHDTPRLSLSKLCPKIMLEITANVSVLGSVSPLSQLKLLRHRIREIEICQTKTSFRASTKLHTMQSMTRPYLIKKNGMIELYCSLIAAQSCLQPRRPLKLDSSSLAGRLQISNRTRRKSTQTETAAFKSPTCLLSKD